MKRVHMPNGLIFFPEKESFENCSKDDALRYLKGLYLNKSRFKSRFLIKIEKNYKSIHDFFYEFYSSAKPFSFSEAFAIKNDAFKAVVFGSINIGEMITHLGAERISTKGMPVKRKIFSKEGSFLGYKEYDNIYELHKVNGKKLGVSDNLYVVKCWCTSTNKEHYIWVEEKYSDCPLKAIASTFRFHENIIPHIKEMKRQGDIMLVEMDEDILPAGNVRPLTEVEYFDLLTAES